MGEGRGDVLVWGMLGSAWTPGIVVWMGVA